MLLIRCYYLSSSILVQTKKTVFFCKFYIKFLAFSCLFSFCAQKMLKIHILTSFWVEIFISDGGGGLNDEGPLGVMHGLLPTLKNNFTDTT